MPEQKCLPQAQDECGEWWHICWLTDHRYHPPLPPHFTDEKTEAQMQNLGPNSSGLTAQL